MSVRIEGQHPDAVAFLFERAKKRAPGAAFFSALVHVAAIAAIAVGLRPGAAVSTSQSIVHAVTPNGIIWIAQGPPVAEEHGGGGGGLETKQPPGKVELPGEDALTVPVEQPRPVVLRAPAVTPLDVAPPIAQLDISALRTAAGADSLPGAIDGVPGRVSQGPGTGGGAGSGDGTGDGPGKGPGRGPGSGGNEGGGPMRPGVAGLRNPVVVREVKPLYTGEAMRARIQGTVALECVVLADGTVADVHVVRSLDARFGLDREAARAAAQWRFIPGTLKGQPVPVMVRIELDFTLQ